MDKLPSWLSRLTSWGEERRVKQSEERDGWMDGWMDGWEEERFSYLI